MNKSVFIVVALLFILAVANNFYSFYLQKDYKFRVEASCDAGSQTCFVRDCSDGECPPNNLDVYRTFSLEASDFGKCSDDSCLQECLSGSVGCEEIMCDPDLGDSCTGT